MKLRTTEELWILDGEIGPPWVQFRDGTGALGLASQEGKPVPIRIPKGSVIYVDLPERTNDPQTRVPVSGRGMDTVHLPAGLDIDIPLIPMGTVQVTAVKGKLPDPEWGDVELLATLGHTRQQDLLSPGGSRELQCGCTCKGCGSGGHCYDNRCYPLPVKRFGEELSE